ncbi:MAG: envelope stress response membrane protein PspC [Bacteriovoracaceae bacterium]|nr:envelope stress response membrane protein PspC [Bacteriovoracaceae bacterium]
MKYDNSINPHRLYRNRQEGWIAGVCSGLADYLDVSPGIIRFLAVIFFMFSGGMALFVYIVGVFLLKPKPTKIFQNHAEEVFWRGVTRSPRDTLSALKYKFMVLNEKVCKMEDHVTSREYELEQEYKNL